MTSLTKISDAFAQLASDGVPEPVALLTIARLAIDAARAQIATSHVPEIRAIHYRLGTPASSVLVERDCLDAELAVAASSTAPSAANAKVAKRGGDPRQRPQLRTKKPSPVDSYRVGQLVDVLGSNTDRVEYVGKVIKLTTRLHVQHLDPNATGHMAYEAKFVRERIRPHVHDFGAFVTDDERRRPKDATTCCIGCEKSARELGIATERGS